MQMIFSDSELLPISALQHMIFCERQCALIHVERVWVDNQWTAEGNVLHKKTHEAFGQKYSSAGEMIDGVRVTRSLWLVSRRMGLIGQADVVEFDRCGRATPVEYKRGRPKKDASDRIQLCAQAICLEEQLDQTISRGFLFYGTRKRRTEVLFDESLRRLVRDTTQRLREMIDQQRTPAAARMPKCSKCSLQELCLPDLFRFKTGAASWNERQFAMVLNADGPTTDDNSNDDPT